MRFNHVVIAMTLPDGRTRLRTLSGEGQSEDETDDAFLARMVAECQTTCPDAELLTAADLPGGRMENGKIKMSRNFRNAFTKSAGKVDVDMPKARAIHMERIRKERDRRLAETDVEIAKLDGAAVPARLKSKRQALRDIPQAAQPDIDAIADPDILEGYTPGWPS